MFDFLANRGVRAILVSVSLFAIVTSVVKYIDYIPFQQLVFFRALISFVFCFSILRRKGLKLIGKNYALLLARGLFGTMAITGFFYTLQVMPLASAVTVQYMNPIFSILISSILLRERPQPQQWLYYFLAFLGVVLVKGFDPRVTAFALLIGVGAAVCSGLAYNMVRMLAGKEHELVVVIYFPLVTLPLITPFAIKHWVWPVGLGWFWVVVVGVCTHFAQVNLTRAYQLEKTSKVSIFNFLGPLFAMLSGYLIFKESLHGLSLMGIGLILISALLNSQTKELTKA